MLFNIGVVGTTWIMGYAGFKGGTLLLEGTKAPEIHQAIIGLVPPIGISVVIGALSTLIGAIT